MRTLLTTRAPVTRAALALAALALLSGLLLSISQAEAAREVPRAPKPAATASPAVSDTNTPTAMEAERITVRRYGFEPARITRPAGRFVLALDNRSDSQELDLRLTRAAGGWGRQRRLSGHASRWHAVVDPPPGLYVLTEAGHPGWECRILITPR